MSVGVDPRGQGDRYVGKPSRRWPDGRPLCGAETRAEGSSPTCLKTAGEGTEHYGTGTCKRHLGSTRNHVVAAQKEMAARALNTYGAPRQIDPRDGLIEEYWRTAGAVAWLETRVQGLDEQDLVWGVVEETVRPAGDTEEDSDGTDRPSREVKRKAAPSVWLALFQQERKKFSDLGVEIVRLGLEARRDEYAQRMGVQMHGVFGRAIERAGLPVEVRGLLEAALLSEMQSMTGQQPTIEGTTA